MRVGLATAAVFAVVAFFAYQFKSIRAPGLALSSPAGDMETAAGAIDVRGTTDPDADVSLNGRPLFIGPDGAFEERLLLIRGVNRIDVVATSRYGRQSAITRYVVVP